MIQFLQGIPLLLMAAFLLILSAMNPEQTFSAPMLAAGFVVFGAWTAMEVVRVTQQMNTSPDGKPEDERLDR